MRVALRRASIAAAVLLLVAFVVIVLNQTAQLVSLADRVSPIFGTAVLWVLVLIYAGAVAVPVYLYVRLPKTLVHPDPDDSEAISRYRLALAERLQRNPHLEARPIESEEDVSVAIAELNKLADEVTRRAAAQVFLTTAISQNGSLDGVVVIVAQSRLVLNIARIYNQRPGLHDLVWLYTNVAGTAFVATSLEDIDVAEQIQPMMSSFFGSTVGAIPGFQAGTAVLVNSVMNGSANAFLTLRIGMIAKQYCASIEKPERGVVRKSASLQAAKMLTGIALEGTRKISGGILSASTRPMRNAVGMVGDSIRASASAAAGLVRRKKPEEGSVDESIEDESTPA